MLNPFINSRRSKRISIVFLVLILATYYNSRENIARQALKSHASPSISQTSENLLEVSQAALTKPSQNPLLTYANTHTGTIISKWAGLPSFARKGYYCQFQGTFCMPASKIQTQKILSLCGPSSDKPGFEKFGEKIVERTLTEMLRYEPGGAVLELGAQNSFLDLDLFHRDREGSQIFTFQPDFIEFAKVERKFRSVSGVHVFHSAIFAKKENIPELENDGSVSASYFKVNKSAFLASRKRKRTPPPENPIYTNKNPIPDNLLLSEALSFVKQKSNRQKISALVINCEGCEYPLINFLTENGKELASISTVVVQFHRKYTIPGIDSLTENYCELKMRLSRTHCLLWSFNYVWEAWVSHEYCI